MANNHEQFKAFHDSIKATATRRNTLKKNRDALRDKIKKYFKENHSNYIQPTFFWQGSYAMHTLLNPIKDEDGLGAYDLDDGIYFKSDDLNERKTIEWYHDEVYEAVKDHTDNGAEDLKPCVRVQYADGHHIDLAIYFLYTEEDKTMLAHKAEPWHESNPDEMIDWFSDECKNKTKFRELVRFMKAWCEYKRSEGIKMPSGCIMSMLTSEYYQWNDENRYDIAMRDILKNMYDDLSKEGHFHCWRPVAPGEDLFDNYTKSRKDTFLKELKSFKEDAEKAIESKNPHDACIRWQAHFGDRFSCSTAKDEDEDASKKEFSGKMRYNSQYA